MASVIIALNKLLQLIDCAIHNLLEREFPAVEFIFVTNCINSWLFVFEEKKTSDEKFP
jgi:hypothetical protein